MCANTVGFACGEMERFEGPDKRRYRPYGVLERYLSEEPTYVHFHNGSFHFRRNWPEQWVIYGGAD